MARKLKTEDLIYSVVWLAVFLVPLVQVGYLAATGADVPSGFLFVLRSWRITFPFFGFFLIHNYLIAPFFTRGESVKYALLCIFMLIMFAAFAFVIYGKNRRAEPSQPPAISLRSQGPPHYEGAKGPVFEGMAPGARPDGSIAEGFANGSGESLTEGPDHGPRGPEADSKERNNDKPLAPPGWLQFLLCVLMLGANLAVKFYFKSLADGKRLREIEKENLLQQLKYLRYQINPHFFMNTLNNIHALVDIDPEKAKETILELSKLMRYILYDGGKPMISLDNETEFLKHYITLMQIRYSDKVSIEASLPESLPYVEVPPLIYVTFVENAFKHGISYEEESFVKIDLRVNDDKLVFRCVNSKHSAMKDGHSGIGMVNTRKRLELLFGSNFTLKVGGDDKIYDILLIIPITNNAQ